MVGGKSFPQKIWAGYCKAKWHLIQMYRNYYLYYFFPTYMNFEEDEMKESDKEMDFDGSEPVIDDVEDLFEEIPELDTPILDEFTEGDPDEEDSLGSDDSF